jgi:biotin carboxyl carrier protein
MKMENEIVAPVDGVVAALRASEGASVNTGDALVDLA